MSKTCELSQDVNLSANAIVSRSHSLEGCLVSDKKNMHSKYVHVQTLAALKNVFTQK